MTDEQTFLNEKEIVVTNARFIVGSQTYAMNAVTSVSPFIEPASRGWSAIMVIIGFVLLIVAVVDLANSIKMLVFGLVLMAVGIWAFAIAKDTHVVRLATASGEVKAYRSKDKDFVNRIIGALNDAIVHRG